MAFEIHREPLYRRYYAPYYSAACLYTVAVGFLLIFIPFIISYSSSNLWLKNNVVYEQLDLTYQYQAIFQFYGEENESPLSLSYSTSPKINDLYSDSLRMSVFRSNEVDENNDGVMDRLEVGIQVPLGTDESITRMSAVFYHTAVLKDTVRYIFDTVSYVNHDSGTPMGSLLIDGDVILRQSTSLSTKGGYRLPYTDDPLLDITEDMSIADVNIGTILSKSAARNLTTNFIPTYTYAVPMISPNLADVGSQKFFNATMTMRVPVQKIVYIPSASEVLKHAWIQYVSFFIVVGFLLVRLTSFILRHRLIYATPVADVVHEKLD
jgi:transmembrane protein 231